MTETPVRVRTLRQRAGLAAGSLTASLSRRLGRGGGSTIGGRVSLAVAPDLLARLAEGRRVALVSATNGKTTTTRMLAAALAHLGEVAHNDSGANLPPGLVAALAAKPAATVAALEIDEQHLRIAATAVRPAVVVLLNLSRDQLDRVSEVRKVAERWHTVVAELPPTATVVANADDPLVAWAAGEAVRVQWVSAGVRWTEDSTGCPRCGELLRREAGSWSCSECGLARPTPQWTLCHDVLRGPDGLDHKVIIGLPGAVNRINAAFATAAAHVLGVPVEVALRACADVRSVAGRYAVVPVAGRSLRLLLAKNPAGWGEMLDLIDAGPSPLVLAVNARAADGRDTSWLWDVPFERLAGRDVTVTGDRRLDIAVRLHYAGVAYRVAGDVEAAVRGLPDGAAADVVANYTALHDILRTHQERSSVGG